MAFDGTPNVSYSPLIQTLNVKMQMRQALKPLEKDTLFAQFFKPDELEKQRGRTVEWYMPMNFTENTAPTQTNEANVGSSMTYGNRVRKATVGVYDDFATISRQTREFSPTNDLLHMSQRMAYYAAVLFDNLHRNMVDYSNPELKRTPLATYAKVKDFTAGAVSLQQNNVRPMAKFDKTFAVAIAPILTFDIEYDPDIGSINDLFKRSANLSGTPLVDRNYTSNRYMQHGGVTYFTTTNVKTYTSGGSTYYRSYMFGDEAFGSVELSGQKLAMSANKEAKERFSVKTREVNEDSLVDPTNKIAGYCAFRGVWGGNKLYDIDGTKRAIQWDHQATIA